ncbi:MAG TPA: TadE/TadG family type IV pilus assembly protein [Acidimicrobiia bacterium]|nr:TadE/TadG family type IV pilus assembly protein [Acidimicrobiia bacterium]
MAGADARRAREERGASLVEFALILPLLMLFVFGIIEFGGTYNNFVSLRNGVREGARLAVVNDQSNGDILTETKQRIGLDASQTKVRVVLNGTHVGDTVTVCASYPAYNITGVMRPFLGNRVVTSSVTMRLEQVPSFTSSADPGAPTCS